MTSTSSTPKPLSHDLAYWSKQRLLGDQVADASLQTLMREGTFKTAREGLGHVMRNVNLKDASTLPTPLKVLVETADDLPDWANASQIKKAQEIFGLYGVEIAFILLLKSLPECYTMKRGSVVLESTGRLLMSDGRKVAYTHRVMMTLQFVINVMSLNGFAPQGKALESLLKVRLIHASIRHFLKIEIPEWDTSELGLPINQEDLTFTLTTFSVTVIKGLAKVGIKLNPEEKEAFNHLWAVAASKFGILQENIPLTYQDAEAKQNFFFATQAGSSPAGKILTESVIEFTESIFPGLISKKLVRHLINLLVGKKHSALLGIHQGKAGKLSFLDRLLFFCLRTYSWLLDNIPPFRLLTTWFNKKIIRYVMKHFTRHTNIDFKLPLSLKK